MEEDKQPHAEAETPPADRAEMLEQKLEEAIDVLIRRDKQLEAAERRILYLEEILDAKDIPYAEIE